MLRREIVIITIFRREANGRTQKFPASTGSGVQIGGGRGRIGIRCAPRIQPVAKPGGV